MNYSKIRKYDVANGEGIRTSIFFSGCTLNCKNCFNNEIQDFKSGNEYTEEIENTLISYLKDDNVVGLSLLGGEVFQQDLDIILKLVKRVKKETNKSIWCWTGYTLEHLYRDKKSVEVLKYIDILIDGRFVEELKDLKLKFRGSSNQRLIDMQKTLIKNKIILLEE